MLNLIDKYIDAHRNKWAASTLRSERARLRSVALYLTGDPEVLFNRLSITISDYTRLTVFVRVGAFWKWAGKGDIYLNYMRTNSRLFANSYVKERLDITYEEAASAINSIENTAVKKRALEILNGAVRYCESAQPIGETVVGKGGTIRPDFRTEIAGPAYEGSYVSFWRAMKKVGLKPHTLRKLALTRLVENGASLFDLMEVAGWSSTQPASSYIQPKQTAKLKKLLAA